MYPNTQILHCFSNRSLRIWWMVTVAKVSLSLKKVLIFPLAIVASGDVCSSPKYSPSNMTECTNLFSSVAAFGLVIALALVYLSFMFPLSFVRSFPI